MLLRFFCFHVGIRLERYKRVLDLRFGNGKWHVDERRFLLGRLKWEDVIILNVLFLYEGKGFVCEA